MMVSNSRENLVIGGFFGSIIGSLFLAFGGLGNFFCEILFWSFVLYVGVIYFEIAPKIVKNMMRKYGLLAQCLMSLAWVPLFVGGAIVLFLGSLLFIDYSAVELKKMLVYSKTILFGLMFLSVFLPCLKKVNCFQLMNF